MKSEKIFLKIIIGIVAGIILNILPMYLIQMKYLKMLNQTV